MFNLQEKWIELDSLLEGVQSEMKEKQIVSNYLKSLGMKRTVPVVIQQKLQDRRLARIYVWKNSPIGNVALLTGRSIEPSLHFLVLETENHDGDEIDMAVAVSGTNYVSIPIPHTLERRMAQNSHSVHQQPVHSQRPIHHKSKPVQRKSKAVKSKRKQRKPARHNPTSTPNALIAPSSFPKYIDSDNTIYLTMKESFPSVWLLTVLNKFFPEIVVSSKVQLGEYQLTVVLDSPYLSKQNYKLSIEYKYLPKKKWMDLNIHLQDKATSTVVYTWGVELLSDDAQDPTSQRYYADAIHSKLMPFIGKEIQTYISNPSGYVHPTDFAKVNLSNVRPRQMKNHIQPRPVLDENNQPIEDFESGDNNAREQNREIIEQTVEGVRSRTSTEPAFDEIDEQQDQSDKVRIKYDFEGLQEEPIIPITDDLLFTLDDFSDVKWTTKITYKNLWWIFAKNMTLKPLCDRLSKLFIPHQKWATGGGIFETYEWCIQFVSSELKAGKQTKTELIFGLTQVITDTRIDESHYDNKLPFAFGITSQSNGLRLRVGNCTNGKSLNGFTPQKAYRMTMPYKQFKGMHLTDVMVAFFNMVLIHILSNPNILAKIGEYCQLPTRDTFTGVTKTVVQPTVDRSTVQPRPVAEPSILDTVVLGLPNPLLTNKQKDDIRAYLNQKYDLQFKVVSMGHPNYINYVGVNIVTPTDYIQITIKAEGSKFQQMVRKSVADGEKYDGTTKWSAFSTVIDEQMMPQNYTVGDLIPMLDTLINFAKPKPTTQTVAPNILDTIFLDQPLPQLSVEQKDAIKAYLDQKYNLQFDVVTDVQFINYIQVEIVNRKDKAVVMIHQQNTGNKTPIAQLHRAKQIGVKQSGEPFYDRFEKIIEEDLPVQAYTVGDLIPILNNLIRMAKPKPTTQSVRDTLSSVMPQIEFINSLDQVSTEPSLNRWYAGSLAYDFPTTGNYFEIVLFAHLMADNKLKLTIQVNSGAGFNFSQNDDYFAVLAKVEQTPQGTDLTRKTWEIVEGWYNFLQNMFNLAGIASIGSVSNSGEPQFIIHLGQQTTQRVASPATQRVATPLYNDFHIQPTSSGLVISPKGTINQIFLDLETDTSWLSDLFNAMKTGLYFKKGDLEWVDGYIFKQTNDDGSIITVGVDTQDATVLNNLIGNIDVLSQNYPKSAQEPSIIEGVTANQDALNLKSKQHTQLRKFITKAFQQDFPQWNAFVSILSDRVVIYLSDLSLIKRKYNFMILINKDGLRIFGFTNPYFDNNSLFNIDAIANQVSVLTIQDLFNQMILSSEKLKEWIASNGSELEPVGLTYFGSSEDFAKHLRKNPYSSAIAMQIDEQLKTLSVVLVTITGHKQKAPKLFIKPVAYVQMYDPTKMNFTSVSWDKIYLQDHSDLVDNSFIPMAYFKDSGLGYHRLHYNEIKTISDYLIVLFEEGVVSWTQSISTLPIALNPMVAELSKKQSIANSIAEIKGMVKMLDSLAPLPIDNQKLSYEYSIDQNKEFKRQEPRIQTPKIQLADAMEWAVKRGVFNFENYSTFKAPAQDKELMDLYSMVVNEYGSIAGQDLFDTYTASWNKAYKDFTDAQLAQQQAQQSQSTVEPPQGSTGSLGTQISTIDDVLQYPDGTLFVTPNQNNDYEIRVFAKVGDELFGFDEDGSALTLDFDELEDVGDLFYQSIQVDPFRIQQVYFNQSESKQMVADALQAIGM